MVMDYGLWVMGWSSIVDRESYIDKRSTIYDKRFGQLMR